MNQKIASNLNRRGQPAQSHLNRHSIWGKGGIYEDALTSSERENICQIYHPYFA